MKCVYCEKPGIARVANSETKETIVICDDCLAMTETCSCCGYLIAATKDYVVDGGKSYHLECYESEKTMKHYVYPTIRCPYCSNEFKMGMRLKPRSPFVTYCDVDDTPGCGKMFVVVPEVVVTLTGLKVEE
jgi:DNA-directed RNA polymerase subunit RPC12/RpoP